MDKSHKHNTEQRNQTQKVTCAWFQLYEVQKQIKLVLEFKAMSIFKEGGQVSRRTLRVLSISYLLTNMVDTWYSLCDNSLSYMFTGIFLHVYYN